LPPTYFSKTITKSNKERQGVAAACCALCGLIRRPVYG
jgi:hypothetical protein